MNSLILLLTKYTVEFWSIIGLLLIIAELYGFTIILLFASFSAFTLCIFAVFFPVIHNKILIQLALFAAFCFTYTISLYKPLRGSLYKKRDDTYKNIIGDSAVIIGHDLTKDKIGTVKWSGTICKAKTHEDLIKKGTTVSIISVEQNIFNVKKKK